MDSGQHAEKETNGWARSLLSILLMVVFVALATILLRTLVFVPYEIPSGSMEDTIMTGDMVFSEKVSYYFREPEQGDIVTFEDPMVAGRTLIKRVVATGGQTVDLVDGVVYVDGKALAEPYTQGKPSYPKPATLADDDDIVYPFVVPDGYIWVMGDNRTSSQDSRYFGAVSVESVTGRAAMVYWPFNHIGILS